MPIRHRTVDEFRAMRRPAHAAVPQGRDAGAAAAGDNRPMDIQLNGVATAVAEGITVQALLEQQGLAGRRVAVEVNGEIVARGRHATHALQPGDRIEIVHALGGG